MRHATFGLTLASLLLAAAAAGAPKKKPAPKPAAPIVSEEKQLSAAAERHAEEVQRCALEHALAGGAKQVEVRAKITVNSSGQVFGLEVTVTPPDEPTKTCVDKALRSAVFPRINAPLATIDRSWTFAVQ